MDIQILGADPSDLARLLTGRGGRARETEDDPVTCDGGLLDRVSRWQIERNRLRSASERVLGP
jgi:hypothetical protein